MQEEQELQENSLRERIMKRHGSPLFAPYGTLPQRSDSASPPRQPGAQRQLVQQEHGTYSPGQSSAPAARLSLAANARNRLLHLQRAGDALRRQQYLAAELPLGRSSMVPPTPGSLTALWNQMLWGEGCIPPCSFQSLHTQLRTSTSHDEQGCAPSSSTWT